MSYSLYIEREHPIELDEWIEAVGSTPLIRIITTDDGAAVNPKTKEKIKISMGDGGAEVFDEEADQWFHAITWHGNKASFASRGVSFGLSGHYDPIWESIKLLARKLNASIVGEEGEEFPLEPIPIDKG